MNNSMNNEPNRRRMMTCYFFMAYAVMAGCDQVRADWSQWGGPNRNFVVDTSSFAEKWPEDGPKRIWHRKLGTGYSGIAIDNAVLYTMYRTTRLSPFEYVVALDAATGNTIWQHKERAKIIKKSPPGSDDTTHLMFTGPNTTPLVVGERIFTVGRNAILLCLGTADGKVQWKKDLQSEFQPQDQRWGFSSSPIAFENTVIVPIGQADLSSDENRSLIAYDQATGDVVWKSQVFQSTHSSPILINFQGTKQLVHLTKDVMIGINPSDGSLLWQFEYPDIGRHSTMIPTPVYDGSDTIYVSSTEAGCAIKLIQKDSKTVAEQLWLNRKTPLGRGTPIFVDGLLIGAKLGSNAAFLAVEMKTGKRKWLKRHFVGANILGDHKKQIVLDEDGELSLIRARRRGMTIKSQCQVTAKNSFTPPSLVGSTLYVRDEKHIMAFDLSKEANR